jgi:ATP-binding cassette subfamily B protein
MIAKYYGRDISIEYLRLKSQFGQKGVSMLGLTIACKTIGLNSKGVRMTFEELIDYAPLPAILHWNRYHFVVLTPQSSKRKLVIADPAKGILNLAKDEFLKQWLSTFDEAPRGVALLLETMASFESSQRRTF